MLLLTVLKANSKTFLFSNSIHPILCFNSVYTVLTAFIEHQTHFLTIRGSAHAYVEDRFSRLSAARAAQLASATDEFTVTC